MSFGANIYDFPSEKMELFLDVLEAFPDMRLIIKYDSKDPLTTSLNVTSQILAHNWWPQQAILGQYDVFLNVKI